MNWVTGVGVCYRAGDERIGMSVCSSLVTVYETKYPRYSKVYLTIYLKVYWTVY